MSAPGNGTPTSGDRWNVNMPAVIGVVFVFLVAVIVWVVVTSGDDVAAPGSATNPTPADGTSPADVPGTTSASPMPSTTDTAASTTSPPTTTDPSASTTVPVTAAPGADPDAVPGDLGISGRPMQQPRCDNSYITVLASSIGDQATAGSIGGLLGQYSGSEYLRTDQTCPSLRAAVDGQPIYVVYFGPFAFESDACVARANGPEGAYARILSTDVGPNHSVSC